LIGAFQEVKFLGTKALVYADFCKAIDLINTKSQLTREGLEAIRA
jgi:hypothetical protein